jgi:import receptor subunit TOM70
MVLKRIAAKKAKEMFSHGQAPKSLPSLPFCSAYLNSFRYNCAHILSYAVKSAYDEFFVQAVKAYHQNDWDSAVELLDKSLHLELSAEFKGAAFNMRGTFFFLMGRSEEAYSDYEKSLEFEPKCVNTLIKIACLMMEKENGQGIDQALRWFERALQIDENDADIFYHRGQVYFLVQDYTKALADYNRSIELDDEFAFSHIQRAVSLYRLGKTRESKTEFDSILAKFPHSADIHYYYGEILLDQRLIDDALMEFDKAISINCNLPLPYLNKVPFKIFDEEIY